MRCAPDSDSRLAQVHDREGWPFPPLRRTSGGGLARAQQASRMQRDRIRHGGPRRSFRFLPVVRACRLTGDPAMKIRKTRLSLLLLATAGVSGPVLADCCSSLFSCAATVVTDGLS